MKIQTKKSQYKLLMYVQPHIKLIIESYDAPIMELYRGDFIKVSLKIKKKKVLLAKDFFFWIFEQQWLAALEECLQKNRLLDSSITESIGRLSNFVYHGTAEQKNSLVYTKDNNHEWVGEKYGVWTTANACGLKNSTWLYNDASTRTVFSVTPSYQYYSVKPLSKFLKKYKPLLQMNLSEELLQKMFDTISHIVKTVNINTAQAKATKTQPTSDTLRYLPKR